MTAESSISSQSSPRLWRRVARLLLLSLVALATVMAIAWAILASDWVREKARVVVEKQAGAALGRVVSVAELDFDLLTLSAEAIGVVVGGPTGLAAPLARVERLEVRVGPGLVGALRGRGPIVLEEITVDGAVFDLWFDEEGASNLPDLPEREDPGDGPDVRIGELRVTRGTVRLEERSMPLEFAALAVEASLREEDGGHLARVRTDDVALTFADGGSLHAELSLDALISDGGITLREVRVTSANLSAEASGELRQEAIDLAISASIDAALLEELGWAEDVAGKASLETDWSQRGDDWSVHGTFAAPELAIGESVVSAVEGAFSGHAGGLDVHLTHAHFAGARLEGDARVDLARIDLGVDEVPIAVNLRLFELDLAALLAGEDPVLTDIEGLVSGTVHYHFVATDPTGGTGEGSLEIAPPPAEERTAGALALSGSVDLEIAEGRLTTEDAELTAPGQRVVVSAEIDLEGLSAEVDFVAETSDPLALLRPLPALEDVASEAWAPSRGQGSIAGTLEVNAAGFSCELDLDFDWLELSGMPIVSGDGRMSIDTAGIHQLEMVLRRDASRLTLAGSIPFDLPTPAPPDARAETSSAPTSQGAIPTPTHVGAELASARAPRFRVDLEADAWRLGDAAPWLPFEMPLKGTVTGELHLGGSLEEPSGDLDVTVTGMSIEDVELPGSLAGRIAFAPEQVDVGPVRWTVPAGVMELAGTMDPETGSLDLRLISSPVDLTVQPFDEWIAGDLSGWIDISGQLTGTLEEPDLLLRVGASGVDLGGIALGDDGASSFEIRLAEGELAAEGSLLGLLSISGGGRWDETGTDVRIGLASSSLAELTALGMETPLADVTGTLDGGFEIVSVDDTYSARLVIDRLELGHFHHRLSNRGPIVVSLGDGGIFLESLHLVQAGSDSNLFLRGDLMTPAGELDLVIQSSIDASWLGLYLPDLLLDGRLELLATIGGTPDAPRLDGQGRLIGGHMIIEGFPHAVDDMEGLLFFYPDRVVINSGRARFAQGGLTADGTILLSDAEDLSYELRLRGSGMDIRYPEDWRILADGQLTLSSIPGRGRMLTGTVEVQRASYVRDFKLGLRDLMRSMFQRRVELVGETEEMMLETRLSIIVEGPDALQVKTNMATLSGDLDFSLRGNLAQPVILGEIRLDRGGTVELGSAYVVERGTLRFSNPFRNDPTIDLVATARVREYDVRLNVFGPFDDLETSVSSTPPLPTLDVLSLLTTGSSDSLSNVGSVSSASRDSSGAEAFLAGQAVSLAGKRVGELFGLDQVQISPLTRGTSDLSATRVTVGKRISRDVFVTYSYDPSRSDEEVFELAWQLYPSVSVILTRTDSGAFIADVRWKKTF